MARNVHFLWRYCVRVLCNIFTIIIIVRCLLGLFGAILLVIFGVLIAPFLFTVLLTLRRFSSSCPIWSILFCFYPPLHCAELSENSNKEVYYFQNSLKQNLQILINFIPKYLQAFPDKMFVEIIFWIFIFDTSDGLKF